MRMILIILCVLVVNSGCSSVNDMANFSQQQKDLDTSEIVLDKRHSFSVFVPGHLYNAMNIVKTKLLRMGYDRELPTHTEEHLLVMIKESTGTQVFILDDDPVKIIMMEFIALEDNMVEVIFYRDIKDGIINKEVDFDIEIVRDMMMLDFKSLN